MKKRQLVGLFIAFALLTVGLHAQELFLPPAGDDFFPATRAKFRVQFTPLLLSKGIVTSNDLEVDCSGPTTVQRGDPDSRGVIDTEIVSLSLACSGGVQVNLNPELPSRGQIVADSPSEPTAADSFFDIFVEIDIPELGPIVNRQPARILSRIAHIPPLGSVHFGVQPVQLFFRQDDIPIATLVHVEHDVGRRPKPETRGEVSRIFSCFYECKPAGLPGFMQEVTTLMLVNQSPRFRITADVLYLDGNERPIASNKVDLSPLDLDEINVCATLESGLGPNGVPQAGVIEVLLSPTGGAYGWVKNLTDRFPRGQIEPSLGFLWGVGKTECRLVGPNVATPKQLRPIIDDARVLQPILIEGTDDDQF